MKVNIKILFTACLLAAQLASCTIETSDNGKFDGMWHLTRIDTLQTGGALDLSKQKIFWSFQNKLVELDDKQGVHPSVLMRSIQGSDSLVLHSPYLYNRAEGDQVISDPSLLAPFGVNSLEEKFQVVSISGSRMRLQTAALQLTLKKF